MGNGKRALEACSKAHELNPSNEVLCLRGEAHLLENHLQEAMQDFNTVLQSDQSNQQAREGMQRCQQRQHQRQQEERIARQKDYYKVRAGSVCVCWGGDPPAVGGADRGGRILDFGLGADGERTRDQEGVP